MEILKNLPLALFGNLSPAEITRYEKQLHLTDWGVDAQEKLKSSRVFIAGANGLVTAAAFSLVAAGVGHLRVVDASRVSLQDLGDQMLYRERDLNKPKVPVLRQRLQEANPFSEIEGLERKISEHNAVKIIQGADLLLVDLNEGETAAVLNRAAIKSQIPLILAWTQEMRGFIITLKPGQGLCRRMYLPNRTGLQIRGRDGADEDHCGRPDGAGSPAYPGRPGPGAVGAAFRL